MLKKTIFFVILVSFVSVTQLPFNGYCDEWVNVVSNEYESVYYNSSSVKIDKQNKIINVLLKTVFTDEGRINFLRRFSDFDKPKFSVIDHTLVFQLINYKELKYSMTKITFISLPDNVLLDTKPPLEWVNIKSDSTGDIVLKKILNEYNINN